MNLLFWWEYPCLFATIDRTIASRYKRFAWIPLSVICSRNAFENIRAVAKVDTWDRKPLVRLWAACFDYGVDVNRTSHRFDGSRFSLSVCLIDSCTCNTRVSKHEIQNRGASHRACMCSHIHTAFILNSTCKRAWTCNFTCFEHKCRCVIQHLVCVVSFTYFRSPEKNAQLHHAIN